MLCVWSSQIMVSVMGWRLGSQYLSRVNSSPTLIVILIKPSFFPVELGATSRYPQSITSCIHASPVQCYKELLLRLSVSARPEKMLEGAFSVEWLAQSSRSLKELGQHVLAQSQYPDTHSPPSSKALQGEQESGHRDLRRAETAHAKDTRSAMESSGSSVRGDNYGEKSPQQLFAGITCSVSDSGKVETDFRTEECTDRRRLRTVFTVEQLRILELRFQCQQYPGSEQRRSLAGELSLSETQVKTWFQNRRMKLKQQLQDAQAEAFKSRLFLQYFSHPYISINSQYPMADSSFLPNCVKFGPHNTQTSASLPLLEHQLNLPQIDATTSACRFHPYFSI
ncbi:homeobox protein vex1-like isoform X2 [Scyliorhinus canicula]|uniref:homeobox protein vex1-like isoform X2 n=1 Tax=Scyliorhinus canicula TaxID=7830 RepID=UPI0018F6CBE5|nr:homeobox protein vex1-like isoform X2 [Scyliorhinus canicula]